VKYDTAWLATMRTRLARAAGDRCAALAAL
jgi:hypothetical protein